MANPQQWLLSTPRGAYTTAWVQGGRRLIDWPTHLERLVRSLQALHAAVEGFYDVYYTWLEMAGVESETAALQRLVAPAIRAALAAAPQAQDASADQMLVIVLPPAAEQPCGLDVHACAFPYHPATSSPGTAVVLGPPRSVPVGKDSGWVAERQPLEQQRPAGAAEVLLCTPDGRLLEGLVTNLFIVAATADAAERSLAEGSSGGNQSQDAGVAAGSSGQGCCSDAAAAAMAAGQPASFARLEVWTASPAEGVVWGTARARVLEVCRRLGLPVREEAPSMNSRAAWREAFLTNSLRLVQPLARLVCPAGNAAAVPPWQLDLPAAPGPVTQAVRRELLRMLPAVDVDELPSAPA